jgi:hypothetical protein
VRTLPGACEGAIRAPAHAGVLLGETPSSSQFAAAPRSPSPKKPRGGDAARRIPHRYANAYFSYFIQNTKAQARPHRKINTPAKKMQVLALAYFFPI